jgi:hypothetical protein
VARVADPILCSDDNRHGSLFCLENSKPDKVPCIQSVQTFEVGLLYLAHHHEITQYHSRSIGGLRRFGQSG